jgi:hypothetical protein
MSKHIELAKKLKALADKGVGGEKLNAEKMLNSLLKKHNLTIEDIEGEKTDNYFFKLKKEEDERLWSQIVKSVNPDINCYGELPAKEVRRLKMDGNYFITSTLAEYIEIEAKFNIYKRLYKEELNVFYHAFCTANDILVKPKKPIDIIDLSVDELKTYMRIRQISHNIKSEQYRKQLQ